MRRMLLMVAAIMLVLGAFTTSPRVSAAPSWNDGHVGEYDYRLLRGWCPCAFCQGHGAQSLADDAAAVEVAGHAPR